MMTALLQIMLMSLSDIIEDSFLGILGGALVLMGRAGLYWFQRRKHNQLKRDLHPYFAAQDIKKATQFYVETKFQSVPPSQYGELIQANKVAARQQLIPFFLKHAFHPDNDVQRFYIVLAGSGMGKTTFMINLYMRYLAWSRFRGRSFHIKLVPLGYPDVLERIERFEDQENTILLLDGLDEDGEALKDYQKRLDQILRKVRDFRVVVFTCRTQFFPSEDAEPLETHVFKTGSNQGFHTFAKMYLAPFSEKDIRAYLNKRYSRVQRDKKAQAWKIITHSPNLMVRPMILSYIDDLMEDGGDYDYTSELYHLLISKWIEREALRVNQERRDTFRKELFRFSQSIAINVYKNRSHRKGLFITQKEIRPFADQHRIQLEEMEMRSRSLLNRNLEGQYKFAHKSIMEFFLAKEAVENPSFAASLDYEGMDLAKFFYDEMILKKLSLPLFESLEGKGKAKLKDGTVLDVSKLKPSDIPKIVELSLTQLKSLNPIAPLKNLRVLNIKGTKVRKLDPLRWISHLQELDISETPVDDLRPLAGLEHLVWLNADRTEVKNLSPVRHLKNLRYLSLARTSIDTPEALYELYNLEHLSLNRTRISEVGALRKLDHLTMLDIGATKVESINPLRNLKSLESLKLCRLNPSTLRPLHQVKGLKELFITKDTVPEADLESFQKALPDCQIQIC